MNDLVVRDKHYLKHSEEFLAFLGGAVPVDVGELCRRAADFLAVKSMEYRPATLSLLRVGLKKTIAQALGDRQYDSVYKAALDQAFRANVPNIKPEKAVNETKYLKRHEVEALISGCTPRVALLVQFLFYTGARIAEALGLRLSDCIPAGRMVTLRILGKGRKERTLTIPTAFYDRLRAFFQSDVLIFETRNHRASGGSSSTIHIQSSEEHFPRARGSPICYKFHRRNQ